MIDQAPVVLEVARTNPVALAAAWALAKPAGGTLDYRLITEEEFEVLVTWTADRPVQLLYADAPGEIVEPGATVRIVFTIVWRGHGDD